MQEKVFDNMERKISSLEWNDRILLALSWSFLKNKGVKLVLVNPHHVKKSKELDYNSQSKNDRKDPKVIARLVKGGQFIESYIPEGVVNAI